MRNKSVTFYLSTLTVVATIEFQEAGITFAANGRT
jgi:hypothetical protein